MISHPVARGGRGAKGVSGGVSPKVLDLVAAGRPMAPVAHDLEISAQAIYTWRKQQLIDSASYPA
jgi:hypothetical protein